MSAAPQPGEHQGPGFTTALAAQGIESVVVEAPADLDAVTEGGLPDLALMDVSSMSSDQVKGVVQRCSQLRLPVIAMVGEEELARVDPSLKVDDFVLLPLRPEELTARARRLLSEREQPGGDAMVRAGDLAINPSRYEVSLRGRRVNLRFKEYELLLLMATSPGHVFSREALLNRIWGYQYLGGTRTVDVHIRRLRTKLEDPDHSFIETVWNVGYRFRDM